MTPTIQSNNRSAVLVRDAGGGNNHPSLYVLRGY
jgi:hypothetical protein